VIVVDSKEQARLEGGDLLPALEQGAVAWERIWELSDLVVGRAPRRSDPRQITLFKSHGVALEDIAAAHLVYERARAAGIGTALPF